jgi:hypothetical protein
MAGTDAPVKEGGASRARVSAIRKIIKNDTISEMQKKKKKKLAKETPGCGGRFWVRAGGDDADDEVVICFCHRA